MTWPGHGNRHRPTFSKRTRSHGRRPLPDPVSGPDTAPTLIDRQRKQTTGPPPVVGPPTTLVARAVSPPGGEGDVPQGTMGAARDYTSAATVRSRRSARTPSRIPTALFVAPVFQHLSIPVNVCQHLVWEEDRGRASQRFGGVHVSAAADTPCRRMSTYVRSCHQQFRRNCKGWRSHNSHARRDSASRCESCKCLQTRDVRNVSEDRWQVPSAVAPERLAITSSSVRNSRSGGS